MIDMPDITITLLIQRDTNTDEVRGSEQKQRRGGTGWREHVLVTRQSQDSHFLQIQTFWLIQADTFMSLIRL